MKCQRGVVLLCLGVGVSWLSVSRFCLPPKLAGHRWEEGGVLKRRLRHARLHLIIVLASDPLDNSACNSTTFIVRVPPRKERRNERIQTFSGELRPRPPIEIIFLRSNSLGLSDSRVPKPPLQRI